MQALRLGEVLSTIASTEAAIPFTVSLAQAMRAIKAVSSHWLRETCESCREFAWQEGYGAFSVGIAQIERTMDYIQRQEEHHQVQRYEDVFLGFLKRHEIEYDDRYVWG